MNLAESMAQTAAFVAISALRADSEEGFIAAMLSLKLLRDIAHRGEEYDLAVCITRVLINLRAVRKECGV